MSVQFIHYFLDTLTTHMNGHCTFHTSEMKSRRKKENLVAFSSLLIKTKTLALTERLKRENRPAFLDT